MRRTFINLVLAAFFLMAVTACVDNIQPSVAISGDVIAFVTEGAAQKGDNAFLSSGMDGKSASLKTKAPMSSFSSDFAITLSANHNLLSGGGQTYFSGVSFTRNAVTGSWEAASKKYWPQTGSLNFLGYAKKDLPVSNVSWDTDPSAGMSMTVSDNSSLQEDLVFTAAEDVEKQSTAYSLTFYHAMAAVQVTAAAPDGAFDASGNTGVTVTGVRLIDVYNSGTVTATRSGGTVSCSWSSLGSRKNLSLTGFSEIGVGISATQIGSGLVVVPQAAAGIQIEYVIHNGKDASGHNVNLTRTFTYSPSGTWDAGSRYTVAFTISQAEVYASVTLSPWNAASQPWFYATGDAVSWLGANFDFSSSSPMWWRLSAGDSYEALTYVEGTWGSSVKLEATSYYVTVTKSGNTYNVSYEPKRFLSGLRIAILSDTGVSVSGGNSAEVNFSTCAAATGSGVNNACLVRANLYATYSDGSEELVTDASASNVTFSLSFPGMAPSGYTKSNSAYFINGSTIGFRISKGTRQQFSASALSFPASATVSYSKGSHTVSGACSLTMTGNILGITSTSGYRFVTNAGDVINVNFFRFWSDMEYGNTILSNSSDLTPYIYDLSVPSNSVVNKGTGLTLVGKSGLDTEGHVVATAYYRDYFGTSASVDFDVYGAYHCLDLIVKRPVHSSISPGYVTVAADAAIDYTAIFEEAIENGPDGVQAGEWEEYEGVAVFSDTPSGQYNVSSSVTLTNLGSFIYRTGGFYTEYCAYGKVIYTGENQYASSFYLTLQCGDVRLENNEWAHLPQYVSRGGLEFISIELGVYPYEYDYYYSCSHPSHSDGVCGAHGYPNFYSRITFPLFNVTYKGKSVTVCGFAW